MMDYEKLTSNYALFFENLNKDMTKDDYEKFFSKDVYFEDPFQKTYDINSLQNIFNHMYETLHEPRFQVKEFAVNKNYAYLQWIFLYKRDKNSSLETFTGVSRIEFNDEGKVKSHIDYWDSATNIYEKIPLLKNILIFIKNRIKA